MNEINHQMTHSAEQNTQTDTPRMNVQVAAFYQFADLQDFAEMRTPLQAYCQEQDLMGTILLAHEGINGTVAGPERGITKLFDRLREDPRLSALQYKDSWTDSQPFHRMKIKLKKEIVTMGIEEIDPNNSVGTYVKPTDWNRLTGRDDVRLVDTRNKYEYNLGTFRGAEDPQTDSFREFPEWVDNHLDPKRDKHVAMFCTGGIRCEKATGYLLQNGFENVYHLEGGILKYLEEVSQEQSTWDGECFVFDNRVSVNHELQRGEYELCPACRMPISDEDKLSDKYEEHVSCPSCFGQITAEKRSGLLERAKQMELARQRGEKHLGSKQQSNRKRVADASD